MSSSAHASPVLLQTANRGDDAGIRQLLRTCGLADADYSDAELQNFIVASVNDRLIGVAGIEIHGDAAVLRTVAVALPYRRAGWGHALTIAAERLATTRGMTGMFVLTATAADWFRQRGYQACRRNAAPPAIATSTHFWGLSPGDAAFLYKRLI